MKRRELKILGLSYSQSQLGSYVIVLAEKKGNRKLPLIIKPSDAQRIAIEIEGIKPPRPLTHDLFKSVSDAYGIDIQEVYIHTLAEGIFYSKLLCSNGIEDVEVECSCGDAIAFATLYKCPIYVASSILDSSGITINDDGTFQEREGVEDNEFKDEDDFESFIDDGKNERIVSIEDLEQMMEDAIANEEYEIAAELRDRIQMLKDKGKK